MGVPLRLQSVHLRQVKETIPLSTQYTQNAPFVLRSASNCHVIITLEERGIERKRKVKYMSLFSLPTANEKQQAESGN